jgi:hypothetical protein
LLHALVDVLGNADFKDVRYAGATSTFIAHAVLRRSVHIGRGLHVLVESHRCASKGLPWVRDGPSVCPRAFRLSARS